MRRAGLIASLVVTVAMWGLLAAGPILVRAQDGPVATPGVSATPVPDAAAILAEAQRASADAARTLDYANTVLSFIEAATAIISVAAVLVGAAGFAFSAYTASQVRRRLQELDVEKLQRLDDDVSQRINAEFQRISARTAEEEATLIGLRREISERLQSLEHQIEADRRSVATMANRVQDSSLALALTQLAQEQITLGNMRSALDSLRRAQQLDLHNPVVHYFLGEVYVRAGGDIAEGGLQQALENLRLAREQAAALGLRFPEADATYAYATRLAGDAAPEQRLQHYGEALRVFGQLEADFPELLDIYGESVFGALGGLYSRWGKPEEAINVYRRVLSVTPQSSYPLNNLALLSLWYGSEEEAMTRFRQAEQRAASRILVQSWDYWAWFDLLTAQIALNDVPYAEIDKNLNAMLQLKPGAKDLGVFLAGLERLRKPERAQTRIETPAHLEAVMQRVQQALDGLVPADNPATGASAQAS